MRAFSLKSLGHLSVVVAATQFGCSSPDDRTIEIGGGANTVSGAQTTAASTATPATVPSTVVGGAASSVAGGAASSSKPGGATSMTPPVAVSSSPGTATSSKPPTMSSASAAPSTSAAPPVSTGGGSSGPPGNWGKEEDPSAGCPVTAKLPEYAELKADGKLPDPFLKLDGTRIKDKSEWACRRAEISKQLAKYIFGEKPIPPKSAVSGTVSATKISVKVTGGKKDAVFEVSVSMNGATAPAPAIISYGAGAAAPSGVAKITFSAIEASGGSGAKKGPFYDYYGTDHPAGYMVAQAWQVSRIIDVLEQNPGTIDAFHIGLTGCSRNGKGAFAGGAFDNRVALTIPCESGIGGTVALRLKEQMDPGANDKAEWPYHTISYVRWLSEVALGPFATGNDAAGDNTDKLPVDMHEAMALIAPRGLYIVDNPSISNLDPASAYMTGMAGKAIFTALGVPDNFAYAGAGGSHCQWRSAYDASLKAMVDKFLLGKADTKTGAFATDLGTKPATDKYFSWDATELPGKL